MVAACVCTVVTGIAPEMGTSSPGLSAKAMQRDKCRSK